MGNPKTEQDESGKEQCSFRRINKAIQEGFATLLAIAKEDHQENLVEMPTGFLLFGCECSEECDTRVPLKIKTFLKIHKNPSLFCVAPGHMSVDKEELVEHHNRYDVIRERINSYQRMTHHRVA